MIVGHNVPIARQNDSRSKRILNLRTAWSEAPKEVLEKWIRRERAAGAGLNYAFGVNVYYGRRSLLNQRSKAERNLRLALRDLRVRLNMPRQRKEES